MKKAKVLFSGNGSNFYKTLNSWLSKHSFLQSPPCKEDPSEDLIVELPRSKVKRLYELLLKSSSDKHLADMAMAVFPTDCLPLHERRGVILGRAIASQKQLIRELAPMRATPGMRTDLNR